MDLGFEILPKDDCPTCQKLDQHRKDLLAALIEAEDQVARMSPVYEAATSWYLSASGDTTALSAAIAKHWSEDFG